MNLDAWTGLPTAEKWWLAVGMIGQLIFGARFLVQWLVSEKRHHSVIPMSFWYLSLVGGLILLSYAVWRRDPVFIIGQAFGAVVYVRNIMLIQGSRQRRARAGGRDGLSP